MLTRDRFGLSQEELDRKVAPHLVAHLTGNTYAASSLCGLVRALELARKGEQILLCSFGSGAVALAIAFEVVGDVPKMGQQRTFDRGVLDGYGTVSFGDYDAWRSRYWELRRSGGTPFELLCRVEPQGDKFQIVHVCNKCGLVQGTAPEPVCACDSCRGQTVNVRVPVSGLVTEVVPVCDSPRRHFSRGLVPLEVYDPQQKIVGSSVGLAARIVEIVGAAGPVCYGPAYVPDGA